MEKIRTRRKAKAEKPQFPKLRAKYGANRSYRFSLRAWFNFKLYAIIFVLLIAVAVVAFAVLPAADFSSGDKFTDAFFDYVDNVDTTKSAATNSVDASSKSPDNQQAPVRMIGGSDMVLLASEHTHVWGSKTEEVIVPGDCTHEKIVKITETCSCGEIKITIETKDVVHNAVRMDDEVVSTPTCTEGGYYYEVYKCACGVVTSKVGKTTDPTGHVSKAQATATENTALAVSPTCTEPGKRVVDYTCTCGVVIETDTIILGAAHSLVATPTTTQTPTCTEPGAGQVVVACTVCSYVESTTPFILVPTGHNSDVTIDAVSPTCIDTGLTEGKKCSVCGTVTVEPQEVAAKGHTFKCTDNKCAYCDEPHTPTNHNYEKFVLGYKAPTCTESGYEEYYSDKCTVCDHLMSNEVKRDDLPATGHKSSGNPTCTKPSVCKTCNTELKPAKGHTPGECLSDKCTVCNETIGIKKHVDTNKNYKCDNCQAKLRTFDVKAFLYFVCLVAIGVLAVWFLILTIILFVTICKVSTMRLEFYDEVVVWRWGRIFKNHVEQRFVGVYDVLVMPRNKLNYNEKREAKRPAKFGTVLAKVPGGDYEWNRKFFGVKNPYELANFLKGKKIAERHKCARTNFHDNAT